MKPMSYDIRAHLYLLQRASTMILFGSIVAITTPYEMLFADATQQLDQADVVIHEAEIVPLPTPQRYRTVYGETESLDAESFSEVESTQEEWHEYSHDPAQEWIYQCVERQHELSLPAVTSEDHAGELSMPSWLISELITSRDDLMSSSIITTLNDQDENIDTRVEVDPLTQQLVHECVAEYVKLMNSVSANSLSSCSLTSASCEQDDVPGPYISDRLVFRWYQPFIDPEVGLDSTDLPPVFSPHRKKAIIVVHGWLGWKKQTFRQKMRLFHNAKEDVLYGGPLLMGPTGLDLTFTLVTGDPQNNDLGLMLQCAPHADSTVAQGEASLIEFLDHSGRGGCNLEDSYNVGYVDWSQIARGHTVKATEEMLWHSDHDNYLTDKVIRTLLQDIVKELPADSEVIFVGHSLGAGLAIRMQHVFVQSIQEGTIPNIFYGSQLMLADPYFSNWGVLPYDAKQHWPGAKARSALEKTSVLIKSLRTQKEWQDLSLEWSQWPQDYQALTIVSTRNDQTELFGDENRQLKYDNLESVYIELNVDSIHQGIRFTRSNFPRFNFIFHALDNLVYSHVSKYHRRHVYPLFWLLDRMGRQLAMTQTDVLRMTRAARGGGWYRQTEGTKTIQTTDDIMQFNVHVNQ